MWYDAIKEEMTNKDLIGYKENSGHVIFDVKLSENTDRKHSLWLMAIKWKHLHLSPTAPSCHKTLSK